MKTKRKVRFVKSGFCEFCNKVVPVSELKLEATGFRHCAFSACKACRGKTKPKKQELKRKEKFDKAYVLWHDELGFCEGFLYLDRNRLCKLACIAFKRSWIGMICSGFRVREVVLEFVKKNGPRAIGPGVRGLIPPVKVLRRGK